MPRQAQAATCHPELPAKARGLCRNCYERWRAKRTDGPRCTNHPERPAKSRGLCESCYQIQWQAAHYGGRQSPERRKWNKITYQRLKERDPEYSRRQAYRQKYGLTMEQYKDMETRQQGRCAICRIVPERLHVDHDEDTGVVRGLLCGNCNRAIGMFHHDPERLRVAIDYLNGVRLIA